LTSWSQRSEENAEDNCHKAVVASECPSPYCCPHCSNSPENALWDPKRPVTPRNYHLFGPLKKCSKRPSLFQRPLAWRKCIRS
jgi:hypothetical protein